MTNVVLCPNCGGQKTVSKPSYIAGDVGSWVSSSMEIFPCPTCDGRGWIQVDDVSQDKLDTMHSLVLLSMETAENLMDECVKRADKIKELEEANVVAWHNIDIATWEWSKQSDKSEELENIVKRMLDGERAADEEIEKLQAKISSIETREYFVTTELEYRKDIAETEAKNGYEKVNELAKIVDTLATDNTRLKNIVAAYSV